jgi:protein gp37
MSNKTRIEWTDMTSNPIHLVKEDGKNGGHWCKKISAGCANCYAETQNQSNYFGFASHLKYTGETPNLILDEAVLQSWVKLKKPHKIFLCSMTDMFGEWVSEEWILKIFTYFRKCPQHTFQVLTKRPKRMHDIISRLAWRTTKEGDWTEYGFIAYLAGIGAKPLPNVWLGTSIENQKAVSDRAFHLCKLHIRGWKTFYSVEPLLEKVELYLNHEKPDWVIIGGESGSGARPCHYEWILDVVEQCQFGENPTPVFVKQLGTNYYQDGVSIKVKGKGGDIHELPSRLQVREYPKVLATD